MTSWMNYNSIALAHMGTEMLSRSRSIKEQKKITLRESNSVGFNASSKGQTRWNVPGDFLLFAEHLITSRTACFYSSGCCKPVTPQDRFTRCVSFSAQPDAGGSTLPAGLIWLYMWPHLSLDWRSAAAVGAPHCVPAHPAAPGPSAAWRCSPWGRQHRRLLSCMPEETDQWIPGGMRCAAAKRRPAFRGQKQPFEVSIDVMLCITSQSFQLRITKKPEVCCRKMRSVTLLSRAQASFDSHCAFPTSETCCCWDIQRKNEKGHKSQIKYLKRPLESQLTTMELLTWGYLQTSGKGFPGLKLSFQKQNVQTLGKSWRYVLNHFQPLQAC